MPAYGLSRRALLGYAPALTFAAATAPSLLRGSRAEAEVATLPDSIARAFRFQNFMMDAYATGSTTRLVQSYSDEALMSTAFTYDNAVTINAYLASGDAALQERAVVLGDGLLYGQAHPYPFPGYNDGRFPQAFFVNTSATDGSGAYVTPAATPYYFYSSSVGDQAWAGMALAQLYKRTGQIRFLTGALLVANWIVNNTYDTAGAGGFKFGTVIAYINYTNVSQPSTNGKSTEHNIDSYAFFTMLDQLTGGGVSASGMSWSSLAQHALTFVKAMYNPSGPFFYTGTLGDQVTINTFPIPEDTQTWSFLALQSKQYAGTIDWALNNLVATDTAAAPHTSLTGNTNIHGLVFDSASLTTTADDPQAVWLEGTGHMISALASRIAAASTRAAAQADQRTINQLVKQSINAQILLGAGKTVGGKPIPKTTGLVAATSVMDTGFGYTYGPSLHIGATGWYLLGALGANPFLLGYAISPQLG